MVDANATVPGGAEASYMFAVWNLVIRPPRSNYETSQLGPPEFEIGAGIRGCRRDIRLKTQRGFHLECSHFLPRQKENDKKGKKREWQRTPVVIYLHGNASSRLEAGTLVAKLLERNISLFCFDWAGCGISEGEYISLGWHERDDLATVIKHLRGSQMNGPIGIWGRSMGAVSALMHADRDPTIAGICLDSPFSSLRELIEEIAQSERLLIPVPSWLLNGILSLIRMRVKALADFDIEDLVPLSHGPRSTVPALFMHGLQDNFVLPRHSEKLYNNYAGSKEIMLFDGDHNNERTEKVLDRGVGFLCRAFRKMEIESTVSEHLADAYSCVGTQQDVPQRIPHMPRPSTQRQALGDISNVAQQGPGARANEVEAVMKKHHFQREMLEIDIDGTPSVVASTGTPSSTASLGAFSLTTGTPSPTASNGTPTSNGSNTRRPPPRKFSSSLANHRVPSPPRQPRAMCGDNINSKPPMPRVDVPLADKMYNQLPSARSPRQVPTPREGQTPRGDENRRPRTRSKGASLKAMVNALSFDRLTMRGH